MKKYKKKVRTPGFHPGNGGSIPPGDVAIKKARKGFFYWVETISKDLSRRHRGTEARKRI